MRFPELLWNDCVILVELLGFNCIAYHSKELYNMPSEVTPRELL